MNAACVGLAAHRDKPCVPPVDALPPPQQDRVRRSEFLADARRYEQRHLGHQRQGVAAAQLAHRLHRTGTEPRRRGGVVQTDEVPLHRAGVGAAAEAAPQAMEPLLAVAFDVVQRVPGRLNIASERLGHVRAPGPPRPLDQEVRPRRDAHSVHADMQIVGRARPPELPCRAVLGACAGVVLVAREAELDVVAGQFPHPVAQIGRDIVVRRARRLPGCVRDRAVWVDVGDDRPRCGAAQGGAVLADQMAHQALQESRPHRLVGVTAADEAHPRRTAADPVRHNRSPLARDTDLLTLRAP